MKEEKMIYNTKGYNRRLKSDWGLLKGKLYENLYLLDEPTEALDAINRLDRVVTELLIAISNSKNEENRH